MPAETVRKKQLNNAPSDGSNGPASPVRSINTSDAALCIPAGRTPSCVSASAGPKGKVQRKILFKDDNRRREWTNNNIVERLNAATGTGSTLPADTRMFMESRFGNPTGFSHVRIHHDSRAAAVSDRLGAKAFTFRNSIHFNKGYYNPDSFQGKYLLAHELTHVLQQTGPGKSHARSSPFAAAPARRKRPEMVQRTLSDPEVTSYCDAVIADIDQPSPVAGFTSDYPAAFGHIDGLAFSELLQVLDELHDRGYLSRIQGHESEAPAGLAGRLRAGISLVLVAEGDISGQIPSSDSIGSIRGLNQGELNESWRFFRRQSNDSQLVEGLMAMGQPLSMGAVATGPSFRPGAWSPPGNQPIPYYIGNEAHSGIAAHYIAQHLGEEIYANFVPITTLIGHAVRMGMSANSLLLNAAQLALRPDITNLTRLHLYEIKPLATQAQATIEATAYMTALQAAGLPVVLGPTTARGTRGTIPAPAGFYVFWSALPGTIVYQYGRVPPIRVPGRAPQGQQNPGTSPTFMEEMAAITGFTGTALIIYLIISEGTRLFPPRNLVPVP